MKSVKQFIAFLFCCFCVCSAFAADSQQDAKQTPQGTYQKSCHCEKKCTKEKDGKMSCEKNKVCVEKT